MDKREELKLRNLLLEKVKKGEIKCPLLERGRKCLDCEYFRICAKQLKEV